MDYSFTRVWSRASIFVGGGLIAVALLLAAWALLASGEELERVSVVVRVLAALLVTLVGLIVGGTMIVAGQLLSVLLDQRELLAKIHEALAIRTGMAGGDVLSRR